MGSLIRTGLTAAGTAFGGPLGGAAGGFLGSTLTGGDLMESVKGGVGGGISGAVGGVAGAAGSPTNPATGIDKFKQALGLGDNNWINAAKGGEMLFNAIPVVGDSTGFEMMQMPPSLLDTLRARRR